MVNITLLKTPKDIVSSLSTTSVGIFRAEDLGAILEEGDTYIPDFAYNITKDGDSYNMADETLTERELLRKLEFLFTNQYIGTPIVAYKTKKAVEDYILDLAAKVEYDTRNEMMARFERANPQPQQTE